jgi:Glu-tRNA(Gln) amidotransferase subunit E-like FAD-binding protein
MIIEDIDNFDENNPEQEIKTLENNLEKQNYLELPIIKTLQKNKQISQETYQELLKAINNSPKEKLKNIINNFKIENPEEKEILDNI